MLGLCRRAPTLCARRRLSLDWPCSCAACPRSPSWRSSAALTRTSWTTQGVLCCGGVRCFCSGCQALVASQCIKLPRLSAHATACRGMFCGVQGSEEVWDAVRRVSTRVLLVGRCVSCTPVTKARHMFVRTLLRNPREHCFPSSPVILQRRCWLGRCPSPFWQCLSRISSCRWG